MATAWFNDDDLSSEYNPIENRNENLFSKTDKITGLLLGIQASTNLSEIVKLIKELFDFKCIELYPGINQNEAFFIMSKTGKNKQFDYYF